MKFPSLLTVFACLILFGLGELGGAVLGGSPDKIKNYAVERAKNFPDVHGTVGIEDIDRTILDKVSSMVLARLHTFHLHAHGVGILSFLLFLIVANSGFSNKFLIGINILIGIGMLYPFGWISMMFTIPAMGSEAALNVAEKFFFMPFGGSLIIAIWLLIFLYGIKVKRQFGK